MTIVSVLFFGLMFVGLPIGYVLGLAGVAGLIQVGGENFLAMAPKRYFEGLDLFTFMAMPFFILAGEIMNRSGITMRLVAFTDSLVGYLRGGLAHSNMVASVIFAGMTGAAVSDAAAFGTTLVPAMISKGYPKPFACAVCVAGSIIGPTIPPSNLMVIYGSLMGVSIAGLFAAGILPGLLICLFCMCFIAAIGRRMGLPKGEGGLSLWRIVTSFKSSFLALLMPIIILGCILGGIATPTEAAAIAVFYALLVGVGVYRAITFKDIVEMLIRTALITGVVFLIIASASILSWWMTFEQIPQIIARFFLSISRRPTNGDADDPHPAADRRHVHGHQRGPDYSRSGAGPADPEHRHGSRARGHHDRAVAQHRPDDTAGGSLSLRDLLDHRHPAGGAQQGHLALHPDRGGGLVPDRIFPANDVVCPTPASRKVGRFWKTLNQPT